MQAQNGFPARGVGKANLDAPAQPREQRRVDQVGVVAGGKQEDLTGATRLYAVELLQQLCNDFRCEAIATAAPQRRHRVDLVQEEQTRRHAPRLFEQFAYATA